MLEALLLNYAVQDAKRSEYTHVRTISPQVRQSEAA
jgi:hypothetical protein